MVMSKNSSADALNGGKIAGAAALAGYPGAALLVRADSSVVAANAKGVNLETLLRHGAAPGLPALITQAADKGAIVTGTVALTGSTGTIVLDVTVSPRKEGENLLVLARDMTMERNLRSALVESRQRYKDLVEVSSDFAWEIGPENTFDFVSPRGALGYEAKELVGQRPEKFVLDPEEYSPLPFFSDRPLEDAEMWMGRADGSTACVIVSCLPLRTEEGEWRGARGICRDVTEDRERETALARAHNREQLLNYIVNTIRDEIEPGNMLTTAAAATARALGAAGCRIYRQSEPGKFTVAADYGDTGGIGGLDGLLGRLKENDDNDGLEAKLNKWQVLINATHYRQSINGAICMWSEIAEGGWDDDKRILIGDVANQLGIANEQITNHERILKLSRTDSLSGLLNRRAFIGEELPRRLTRLKLNGQVASLLYVDLDNFKMVNDVHGHQRGDEALLFLRDMLIDHIRPGDVVARLGGDEFAVWLDEITPKVTVDRVKALLKASVSLKKFSGHKDHPLGVSIGVALYDPREDESLDDILARADAAMYDVKKAGKGGFRVAASPEESRELFGENASGREKPS